MHIQSAPNEFSFDSKKLIQFQLASKFLKHTPHNNCKYIGRVEPFEDGMRFLFYNNLYRKILIIIDVNYKALPIEPLLTYSTISIEDFRLQSSAQYRQDDSSRLELIRTVSLSYPNDKTDDEIDQAKLQDVKLVFLDFITGSLRNLQSPEEIIASSFGYVSKDLIQPLGNSLDTKPVATILAKKLQNPLPLPDKIIKNIYWPKLDKLIVLKPVIAIKNSVVAQNLPNEQSFKLQKISPENSRFTLFSDGTIIVKFGHPIKQRAVFKDGLLKKLQTYQRIDGEFQLLKSADYDYQFNKQTGKARITHTVCANGITTSSTHGALCFITKTVLNKILKFAAASPHTCDHEAGITIGEAYLNIIKVGRLQPLNGACVS